MTVMLILGAVDCHYRGACSCSGRVWRRREGSTKTLLERLCQRDESPWKDIRGKALDDRGLARMLKPYGIKSRTVRVREGTPKGYEASDFSDAWSRYLTATSATNATALINRNKDVADVADVRDNPEDRKIVTFRARPCPSCDGVGEIRPPAEREAPHDRAASPAEKVRGMVRQLV
jgi:hypothetical protein